jgi:uncharacterized protein (DUF1697 family)
VSRLFAFLRAINVGGRTVRMERLRREFEFFGFPGVETFIASDNVVFDHSGGISPLATGLRGGKKI